MSSKAAMKVTILYSILLIILVFMTHLNETFQTADVGVCELPKSANKVVKTACDAPIT